MIVTIQGRFDATTAPLFEQEVMPMLDAGDKSFLLDLARLDYVSSAALRHLLTLARKAEDKGGRVALLSMQSQILEIFDLAGFTQLFHVYTDREEALRSF